MNPVEFQQAFEHARKLQAQGRLGEAEQALMSLAAPGENREFVLRALVELYRRGGRLEETIDTMVALTNEVPDSVYYYARLAGLLEGVGRTDEAIGHYQRLLQRRPEHAEAHFNLALLYKKSKRYSDALGAYEGAIKSGIRGSEEVYSNMGVLHSELHRKEEARGMYERALQVNGAYVPAMFNLAGLMEESGDRDGAIALYARILALNPRHYESLARIANARKVTSADTSLLESLRRAIAETGDDVTSAEGLRFALGKSLDDLGRYDEALESYRAANELGKLRYPPYDPDAVQRTFGRSIELISAEWVRAAATGLTARPIFICGMFRSGSTLVEQVLAAHPQVTAGGELDNLPLLVDQRLMPYPDRVLDTSRAGLEEIGNLYLAGVNSLFPQASRITDKRPDNFLHLGLIRALFPAARIIYTKRNALDNCLSLYFHQLGGNLGYATDLDHAAHYYRQHVRLMAHWAGCFGDDIFTVDYDAFVRAPEPVVRNLLEFLDLPWDPRCLNFQQTENLVKTASVWQVREGLYGHASGRWKNYLPFLEKGSLLAGLAREPG